MQGVHRPKEYRPELANTGTLQTREDAMRNELGLGAGDMGHDSDEEAPPSIPARRCAKF